MKRTKGMKSVGVAALALLALLFAIGLSGCDRFGGGDEASAQAGENQEAGEAPESGEASEENATVFAVSSVEAAQGQIRDYIELNGDVIAATKVDTYPDTAGKLSKLYVQVGQRVQKNQVVAEVDPSKPGMQFSASPVKAAITGTVTSIPVQVGATVAPQAPIIQISDMEDLEVRVYVAEKFVAKMQEGLAAEISFDAFPDRSFYGRVKELSPVIDPQSRTLEVKISISDGVDVLKAGMFGEVKLVTAEKEGVVKIPSECLVRRFGDEFVFVVDRTGEEEMGEARRIPVTTGIQIDQKLEITSGLEPGMEVVYRGQTLLEDGSKVRVVEQIQPLSGDDELE